MTREHQRPTRSANRPNKPPEDLPTMRPDEELHPVIDNQPLPIETGISGALPHLSAQEVRDLAWAVERLVESFRPDWIYVFGSHTRGTPGLNSDIDLMVVVSDTDEPVYRLDQQGYGVLEPYRLPIELVFITRGDFERRLPVVASLPATVVREGRLLYAA